MLTKRHIEYIFICGMPDSLLFSYLIYIVDKYSHIDKLSFSETHNVGTYRADPDQVHVFLQYARLRFLVKKMLLFTQSALYGTHPSRRLNNHAVY
jgi:hypothetical protein